MANTRRGNVHYVDSTGTLTDESCRVSKIILTSTGATASIVFQDPLDSAVLLDLRVASSGVTQEISFNSTTPIFPNGLKVSALTNILAMVLYSKGAD